MKTSLMLLLITLLSSAYGQDRSKAKIIQAKMREVASYAGVWDAATVFNGRDGKPPRAREVGTYNIAWVLDSCYLRWDVQLMNVENKRSRYFMIMMTYNPDSQSYEMSYFYGRSALRVFEQGKLSEDGKVYTTSAFIPLEDGTRDENVRTITKSLSSTQISYEHFSRYENEAQEWNDFSAMLTRKER